MTTGKVTITAPNGMHARPAGELVKLIRGLAPARVTLRNAAREASAVSILSLLALGSNTAPKWKSAPRAATKPQPCGP